MQKKAIDSSVILHSNLDLSDGGYLITRGVFSEIFNENAKSVLLSAIRKNLLKISEPSEKSIMIVKNAAKESGDLIAMSETDIGLIALAFEEGAGILTDDYAIQNVAKKLKIRVVPVAQDGIEKEVQWIWRCSGCGKRYSGAKKTCEVCGSKVSRRSI